MTDKENWYHISGENNPADLLSRGCNILRMKQSKWWEGPFWLQQPESEWPVGKAINPTNVDIHLNVLLIGENISKTETEDNRNTNFFVKLSMYNFRKLLRIIAWIYRFFNNCNKNKKRNKSDFFYLVKKLSLLK